MRYTEHMSSAWNPPSPFGAPAIEWDVPPPPARLKVLVDQSRSILSPNRSADIDFDWSVNPYRGCTHACAYCYAREWHPRLDLGAGTDFERVVLVKPEAPSLLRAAFARRSWRGERIAFSGATDCYQPLERKWQLTRACLEVCAEHRNPVTLITRSPLVVRDLDVLKRLARHGALRVAISLPLLDPTMARRLEPGAPPPRARLHAIRVLADAGLQVSVSLAPLIPGLNDHQIPAILRAAREAGARWVWLGLLRLTDSVRQVFERRMHERFPDRADAVLAKCARMGVLDAGGMGSRMSGRGPTWQATRQLFEVWRSRLGFRPLPEWGPTPFRRPTSQLGLWQPAEPDGEVG